MTEKEKLIDDLYQVLLLTEHEFVYEIIGNAIEFVKKG
jgi:hypothetical protein